MPDAQQRELYHVLPQFVSAMGYSCAKDWCETKDAYFCGCPKCLEKDGLTLVYNADDFDPVDGIQDHWRKRIVSLRVGRCAAHLICPGFPGHDPGPAVPPEPTESSEDTLPGECPPIPEPD